VPGDDPLRRALDRVAAILLDERVLRLGHGEWGDRSVSRLTDRTVYDRSGRFVPSGGFDPGSEAGQGRVTTTVIVCTYR
jgi:hypothetical protein